MNKVRVTLRSGISSINQIVGILLMLGLVSCVDTPALVTASYDLPDVVANQVSPLQGFPRTTEFTFSVFSPSNAATNYKLKLYDLSGVFTSVTVDFTLPANANSVTVTPVSAINWVAGTKWTLDLISLNGATTPPQGAYFYATAN